MLLVLLSYIHLFLSLVSTAYPPCLIHYLVSIVSLLIHHLLSILFLLIHHLLSILSCSSITYYLSFLCSFITYYPSFPCSSIAYYSSFPWSSIALLPARLEDYAFFYRNSGVIFPVCHHCLFFEVEICKKLHDDNSILFYFRILLRQLSHVLCVLSFSRNQYIFRWFCPHRKFTFSGYFLDIQSGRNGW